MRYDFDTVTNRRGTTSCKWDVAPDELPMWVADMDFQAAPEIIEAMRARLEHGIFGYTDVPDAWYDAIIGWWKDRHGFAIEKDWLIFSTGVVPALSSVVRKLTTPGEKVLIMTPVYNIFFNSIINNGRFVLESPLLYDSKTHTYRIDWQDLEGKMADPQTSMMILCNPHNPIGKIWDRQTLAQIGDLAARHHVIVVSDEIHCDLTEPGCGYVPFASVSDTCRDNSVTCVAATKAFNLAGLQSAAVIVPEKFLRHKVWRGLNTDEVAEPNAFATEITIAAFTQGAAWIDELRAYISQNRARVSAFLASEIPCIHMVPSDATYLLWIDCRDITKDRQDLAAFIREHTGLYLSDGASYGKAGEGFLRLNAACPRSLLEDGLARLKKGIDAWIEA